MPEVYKSIEDIESTLPTTEQLVVFGQQRMDQVSGNEATPTDVNILLTLIETACYYEHASAVTHSARDMIHRNIRRPDSQTSLNFRLNPDVPKIEDKLTEANSYASVDYISKHKVPDPFRSISWLRRSYVYEEGIYVINNTAWINGRVYPEGTNGRSAYANKQATSEEVKQAVEVIYDVVFSKGKSSQQRI